MSDKQTRLNNYDDNSGEKAMGKDIEEFENLRIKEMLSDISGGNAFKSGDYLEDKDGIPLIRSKNFTDVETPHPAGDLEFLPKEFEQEYDTYLLHGGEVLLSMVGQNGHVCLIPENSKLLLNQNIWKLEPDDNLLNWHLYYLLDGNRGEVLRSERGTTRKFLGRTEFENIKLPIPPLSEQKKIATVLYTVDRAIEKTEDTIDRLNRIQKGTLRDLFENGVKTETETQDSPMGRFPKHWELKPMKKVGSLINGNAFPKEYQGVSEEEYPFIKVSDTNDYRRFVTGAENYISKETADEIGCNIQPEGTVILPKRGAAIMTNKRRILAQESAIDNNQIGIVGKEVQPLFLYYYLSNVDMGRFVQDGAVKSLTKSLLSKIRVPVPSPETQSKIVETLESIDERIESERQVKTQQERLKRGLMQDLLSGKVRTTDTNIAVPDEIAQYG